MLLRTLLFFNEKNTKQLRFAFNHHTILELIWTIIPTIILILIAIPSFALLYAIDELHNPKITLKVIRKSMILKLWIFWLYYWMNPEDSIKIDSYMVLEEDLVIGQFRLLEVDERIILPERTIYTSFNYFTWCYS